MDRLYLCLVPPLRCPFCPQKSAWGWNDKHVNEVGNDQKGGWERGNMRPGTKPISLNRGLLQQGLWFDSDWFGSWGSWLWSAPQTLGIILLAIIVIIFVVRCILSRALKACLQPLSTEQMISLRLERQKKNERKTDREREPDVIPCEHHTEGQQKLQGLQSGSWE